MTRLDVGMVARPHGLSGQVIVELWTNRTERLDPGTVLRARWDSDRPERDLRLVSATPHHNRWIVTFDGIGDREGADALRDAVLSAEPIADPDALWVHDLVGSQLVDTSGGRHGAVVAVEANPASDLLVLESGALVPLRFVVEHRPGLVVADVPDGLLE